MIPVSSANIHSIGYDQTLNKLYIQFHTGVTYIYFEVPSHVHVDLMRAGSIGGYHADFIKHNYRYQPA
ncbi:KTSC domain-containing protein [Paenibacillus allorhizosphaerae]